MPLPDFPATQPDRERAREYLIRGRLCRDYVGFLVEGSTCDNCGRRIEQHTMTLSQLVRIRARPR